MNKLFFKNKLEVCITKKIPDLGKIINITKFELGQSNPTYVLLNENEEKFILRTHLLTTALDKALKESDFSEIARLRILLENPFQDQTEVFEKHEIEYYHSLLPQGGP